MRIIPPAILVYWYKQRHKQGDLVCQTRTPPTTSLKLCTQEMQRHSCGVAKCIFGTGRYFWHLDSVQMGMQ